MGPRRRASVTSRRTRFRGVTRLPLLVLLPVLAACSSRSEPAPRILDLSTRATDCATDPAGCACDDGATTRCVAEVARTDDGFLCAKGERRCEGGRLSACAVALQAETTTASLATGCIDGPTAVRTHDPRCIEGTTRWCRAVQHWGQGVTACFDGHQVCEGGAFGPCISDDSVIQR